MFALHYGLYASTMSFIFFLNCSGFGPWELSQLAPAESSQGDWKQGHLPATCKGLLGQYPDVRRFPRSESPSRAIGHSTSRERPREEGELGAQRVDGRGRRPRPEQRSLLPFTLWEEAH